MKTDLTFSFKNRILTRNTQRLIRQTQNCFIGRYDNHINKLL